MKKHYALILLLILFPSCKKKDRLTSNVASFSITPPAATVVNNSAITLTAVSGGLGSISPLWEVSPSTAGTITPAVGQSVQFTPSGLGDVLVYATYDGVQAVSQLAVVTYIPSSGTFDVYTDELIPNDSALSGGLLLFTGGGMSLTETNSGYTPQGLNYFRCTGPNNGFWGITLDQFNTGASKNLSSFASGTLKFALRIPASLGATQNILIQIRDASNTRSVTLNTTHNLNRLSTDWQEISIPITDFTGGGPIDLSTIENIFAIVLSNLSSSLTFDIDAVRWN